MSHGKKVGNRRSMAKPSQMQARRPTIMVSNASLKTSMG